MMRLVRYIFIKTLPYCKNAQESNQINDLT